jgi:hypothetical protein
MDFYHQNAFRACFLHVFTLYKINFIIIIIMFSCSAWALISWARITRASLAAGERGLSRSVAPVHRRFHARPPFATGEFLHARIIIREQSALDSDFAVLFSGEF